MARSLEMMPRPHTVRNDRPALSTPVATHICSFDRPRFLNALVRLCALRGMTNTADFVWLPLKLSRKYVSSNWTDMPASERSTGVYRRMHSMTRWRMRNAVFRHTPQRWAHLRKLRQSTKHSRNRIHTPALSLLMPITRFVRTPNVLLQFMHFQRWEPSRPRPLRMMRMLPQRTHASIWFGSLVAASNANPSYRAARNALTARSRSCGVSSPSSFLTLSAIRATLPVLIPLL